MNSSFTSNYIKHLSAPPPLPLSPASSTSHPSPKKQDLQSLVLSLKKPLTRSETRETLFSLQRIERNANTHYNDGGAGFGPGVKDEEEYALKRAVVGKVVIELYAEALDVYLTEAGDVESEVEWWANVERSRRNVVYYFIQTLPLRIVSLTQTITQSLNTRQIPLSFSTLSPSSLRRLFPSPSTLRPNTLLIAMWPHLQTHPHTSSISYAPFTASNGTGSMLSAGTKAANTLTAWVHSVIRVFTLPYELTVHECRVKRKELEKIRDERAEVLGTLTAMRGELEEALTDGQRGSGAEVVRKVTDDVEVDDKLSTFVDALRHAISSPSPSPVHDSPTTSPAPSFISTDKGLTASVRLLAISGLQTHVVAHNKALYEGPLSLTRPNRLTLLWPRLLLLPPLTLYVASRAYQSRDKMAELVKESKETIQRFFTDWLVEPILGVLQTIRAGSEGGVIVHKEGVAADMESLERMTLALAKDKLNYTPSQLETLSAQIRVGDLTPVLKIYEEDIKSPLKSMVGGSLLRSVFVQVQKAKVDIDQALSGIDKLLKSQELTFAFVGVAPAGAVVYVLGGYLKALFLPGKGGKGRFGGKRRRRGVWVAMRRIERLLLYQPSTSPVKSSKSQAVSTPIPPLTAGLLLLSLTHLRAYAEHHLPARSGMREGFLEDVQDLEDPSLGREEKLRVVERMWRCWGEVLGWGKEGSMRG